MPIRPRRCSGLDRTRSPVHRAVRQDIGTRAWIFAEVQRRIDGRFANDRVIITVVTVEYQEVAGRPTGGAVVANGVKAVLGVAGDLDRRATGHHFEDIIAGARSGTKIEG